MPGAEVIAGQGLTALEFMSGDVLAFYNVTASSIGPPWRSIWHRDPIGRWTIHTNVEPMLACPRYVGSALHGVHVDDIDIASRDDTEVSITAVSARLNLVVRLKQTRATRLATTALRIAPAALVMSRHAGIAAGRLLDTGPIGNGGTTPDGYRFSLRLRRVRMVSAAAAVIDGRDAGPIVRSGTQPSLGRLRLPRGLFIAGTAHIIADGFARSEHGRPAEHLP